MTNKPTLVFTNGCFDILHVGHLQLLKQAAQLADHLIVGLNSDASVRALKGPMRPIQPQDVRRAQLEILPWVHEVIIFDESTPIKLIEQLKPICIVKGSDYEPDQVVGSHVAPVHVIPFCSGHSTSHIIDRILHAYHMK
jgi:D-beta-D-heptose 7-phosphate kinase/D-beta-D-heptose 1-phosphate adenosyltransferase